MRTYLGGEFLGRISNILLPPDIADAEMALQTEFVPLDRQLLLRLCQVEEPDGKRAVFERFRQNESLALCLTIVACFPSTSWSISMTSELQRTFRVNASRRVISPE